MLPQKHTQKKQIRQIESDFEHFKLTVTNDDFIRNTIGNFYHREATRNVFNELLRAKNISEFIDISEKYRIPIQCLLYEWNYVPAQDSPKHILNALNDYCIQIILRKLTNPSDFVRAAETCYRFQANALECFPCDFGKLTFQLRMKQLVAILDCLRSTHRIF